MRAIQTVFIVFVALSMLFGQEPEKKQDKQPTEETIAAFQEVVDGLTTALKEKSSVDLIYYSKEVGKKYKGGDAKQQGKAVALLTKALKTKNSEQRSAAISALAQTGGKASRTLMKEIGGSHAKKNLTYLCECIRGVGRLADPKTVKDLGKMLNHKDNVVVATVISAFGGFRNHPTKLRKEIVKTLLKRYASVASPMTKANPDTSDKERYDALYSSFESSLKILTKNEKAKGFLVWDRWARKEGKKLKEW